MLRDSTGGGCLYPLSFFSGIPRPPSPTLFPYTTLFRSPASNGYNSYFDKDEESIGGLETPPPINKALLHYSFFFDAIADRKSTRLNSSHVRISYAVFCVKKKNKKRVAKALLGNRISCAT